MPNTEAKKTGARRAKAQGYEPDVMYDVRVARVCQIGGATLRPRNSYSVKGSALEALQVEDILSATPKNAD